MLIYGSARGTRASKQSIRSHLTAIAPVSVHNLKACSCFWKERDACTVLRGRMPDVLRKDEETDSCAVRFYLFSWRCKTISDLMINEQIRDKEIRLIGENGEQLGIMSSRDAMKLAEEAGLDLVKIAPTAKPPVCRIVDYGKFRYEQLRKEKEARKKQRTIEIKELRLSPNIDTNDLNTKINAARKFLTKGDKVKVTLRFRGREMAHMNTSKHILDDFAQSLADIAVIEKAPKVEGRSMTMFLTEKR